MDLCHAHQPYLSSRKLPPLPALSEKMGEENQQRHLAKFGLKESCWSEQESSPFIFSFSFVSACGPRASCAQPCSPRGLGEGITAGAHPDTAFPSTEPRGAKPSSDRLTFVCQGANPGEAAVEGRWSPPCLHLMYEQGIVPKTWSEPLEEER